MGKQILSKNVIGGGNFKWSDVNQNEKDHYLGASANQTTTRNGKDMLWYKKKADKTINKKKKKELKTLESDLLRAELGLSSSVVVDQKLKKKKIKGDFAGIGHVDK